MGYRSLHTGPGGYHKQLLRGNNLVATGPIFVDFRSKVFSHVAHPDTHRAKSHIRILIEESQLPVVQCPNILGVNLDTLSFNKHCHYVAERVSRINNIIKALAGTSWGQQKETLRMTYMAVGRSIIKYVAPVWSTNLHGANYKKSYIH